MPRQSPSTLRLPRVALLLLACFPLVFASCEESELFYVLNPDGSGRVTLKERFLTSQSRIKNRAILEQMALATLADYVARSKGVDAWEKVAYNLTEAGDIEVELVALFPELSKVQFPSANASPSLITGLKFKKGTDKLPTSIELRSPVDLMPKQAKSKIPPKPEEIKTELQKARDVWSDAKKNFSAEYGKKSAKVTFHLPGEIASQSNFKKEAKNQVSLRVTAPKILETFSKVLADDELANELLKAGAKFTEHERVPPIEANTFNQLTFGEAKPIRVEFKPSGPLIDYKGAVAQAKANPSALLRRVFQIAAEY